MGFKDLFFVDDSSKEKKVEEKVVHTNQFPDSNVQQPTAAPVNSAPATNTTPYVSPQCQPHMDKILALYEKGFNNLNKPGYDFFEFFKAVTSGGISNPQIYSMAITMGLSLDPTVTKEKLLADAQYYLDEIEKVFNGYVENGNMKRTETINLMNSERETLSSDLSALRARAAEIASEIAQKESALSEIDNKYKPTLDDIDCKLMANDLAKNRLVESITTVKNGITNNLK